MCDIQVGSPHVIVLGLYVAQARQSQNLQNKLMQRKASVSLVSSTTQGSGTGMGQMGIRHAPPGVNIQAPDRASRQMGLGHIGSSFRGGL